MISLAHALLKAVMASNFDVKERGCISKHGSRPGAIVLCNTKSIAQ